MMKTKLIISIVFCLIIFSQSNIIYGQNVGIGTTNPDPSAMLDVNSTSKGFLVPRMSTADRNAITSPVNGLLVYDTDTNTFWFHVNSGWIELKSDNLGDHTATQNVKLNNNWLSGDGDDEGIFVNGSGSIGIGTSPSTSYDINMLGKINMFVPEYDPLVIRSGNSGFGVRIRETDDQYDAIGFYGYSNRGRIVMKSDGNLKINLDANPSISSYINAGNFGIGTDTPDEKLHVAGNMRLNGTFEDKDGDAGTSGQILSSTATGTDWIAAPDGGDFSNGGEAGGSDRTLGNTDNYDLGLKTNNTTRLHIQNDGKIGVGTTNPTTQLDVNGSVRITGAPTSNPLVIRAVSSGWGVILREADNGNDAINLFGYDTRGSIMMNSDGNLKINLDADPSVSSYINAGNFGIGTDTPDEKLHVAGNMRLNGTFEDKDGDAGTSGQILSSTATGTDWIAAPDGGDFSNGGEAGGSDRTLGNTDNYDLGLKTNNTTRLHIQNDGDIGIGTTSPSNRLSIEGGKNELLGLKSTGTYDPMINFYQNGTHTAFIQSFNSDLYMRNKQSGDLYLGTNDSDDLMIEDGGQVGIGTTNPQVDLHIVRNNGQGTPTYSAGTVLAVQQNNNTNYANIAITAATNGGASINFGDKDDFDTGSISYHNDDNSMCFYTNGNEKLRLLSNGNLGLGITNPDQKIVVYEGKIKLLDDLGYDWTVFMDGSQDYIFDYLNGTVTPYISSIDGSYNQNSDRRLKKDINPLDMILGKILKLNPVSFRMIKSNPDKAKSIGFIAQEVEKVFPQIVGEKNGYLSLNYSDFGVLAIKAIQEQQEQINSLKDENQELKDILTDFEQRLEQLENK